MLRKIKECYFKVKYFLGAKICKSIGHKKEVGFACKGTVFQIIDFCPRCGRVEKCISTETI